MQSGIDKDEFKDMTRKEYQMSYRETVLAIKASGKVKSDEHLNELVDKSSKKIETDLEEFIHVTYLVNLVLLKIRKRLYKSDDLTYIRDRSVSINIDGLCKEISKELKIEWSADQIIKMRISNEFVNYLKN